MKKQIDKKITLTKVSISRLDGFMLNAIKGGSCPSDPDSSCECPPNP
ncbi:MAG: hypothetical protein GY765_17565 [bacterium]|nr:hypothetical protein [bacterium]